MLLTWARPRMVLSMPLWPIFVGACGGAMLGPSLHAGNTTGSVVACLLMATTLMLWVETRFIWRGRVVWGANEVVVQARCYLSTLPPARGRFARYRVHLVPARLELDCLTREGALRTAARIEHALGEVHARSDEAAHLRHEREAMLKRAGNPMADMLTKTLLASLVLGVFAFAISAFIQYVVMPMMR